MIYQHIDRCFSLFSHLIFSKYVMSYNKIKQELDMAVTTEVYLERYQTSIMDLVKNFNRVRITLLNHTVKFNQLSNF